MIKLLTSSFGEDYLVAKPFKIIVLNTAPFWNDLNSKYNIMTDISEEK